MTVRAATVAALLSLSATAFAQAAVQQRMQAWSKALGVECAHCHVQDNWTDASKPAFEFAGRMSKMVAALNSGALMDVEPITCWTCHRGRQVPARLQRETWEKIRADHAAEFAGRPNRAIAMSVYAASLGVQCSHCHELDRAAPTVAKAIVREKMLPIFEEIPKHFERSRTPSTQCYMCHQGSVTPQR